MTIDKNSANFISRPFCPICQQEGRIIIDTPYDHPRLVRWLFAEERYGHRMPSSLLNEGRFIVRVCQSCQLLYQEKILGEHLHFKMYEKWISPEFSRQLEESYYDTLPFRYLYSVGLIPAVISDPPSQVPVLDFAAGWGSWALVAQALGYPVQVSELSPSRKSYCESVGLTVVDLDLQNLEEYHSAYKFIHVNQVLEHLLNPKEILQALVTCLKPGGAIYIATPNARPLISELPSTETLNQLSDLALKLIAPLEHINGFTPDALVKLAQQCGLGQVKCRSRFLAFRRGGLRDLVAWFVRPYRSMTSLVFQKSFDYSEIRMKM